MPNNPKNVRMCAACRGRADKSGMFRLIKDENGKVRKADIKESGRSVWVHKDAACVSKLAKRKGLNAAFKCNVDEEVYLNLYDSIED